MLLWLATLLTAGMFFLKLLGVITISWLWVFMPIIVTVTVLCFIFLVLFFLGFSIFLTSTEIEELSKLLKKKWPYSSMD